jgi:sigma-B regulation protein RsbU (phosphoserine phosphatase)
LGDEHFVTMFYAVLDVASRSLEYVNAGHCPSILRRAHGTVEMLESTRPVLGLLGKRPAGAERVRLNSGDCLALYTDGITEAANANGEEFGTDRLRALLSADRASGLLAQHAQILEGVRQFANGKLGDDATLVLVSVGAGADNVAVVRDNHAVV